MRRDTSVRIAFTNVVWSRLIIEEEVRRKTSECRRHSDVFRISIYVKNPTSIIVVDGLVSIVVVDVDCFPSLFCVEDRQLPKLHTITWTGHVVTMSLITRGNLVITPRRLSISDFAHSHSFPLTYHGLQLFLQKICTDKAFGSQWSRSFSASDSHSVPSN